MSSDRPTTPAPPPAPGGARLCLLVMIGDRLDTRVLAPGRLTLGRDGTCDLRIDDASVSRQHAALTVGTTVTVEDLGTVNGTRVGGARLAPHVTTPVRVGEIFHVGTVGLVVQQAVPAAEEPADLVVEDPAMRELHATLARVAAGDISVLLLGETGVGKERCAETVHRLSPRRDRPFVELNCGALTESLLESELFGHEKGAFSGAVATKPGLLETAAGGSVFLDEIGEIAPAIQIKLLRVLEERAVRPVGGLRARPIDVRFIAATNRDLEAAAKRGEFRADLYYRLAGVTVRIPPLRERRSELVPLARSIIAGACRRAGRAAIDIAPDALAALAAHGWPGNIRELRNVLERAVLLAPGTAIELAHLPDAVRAPDRPLAHANSFAAPSASAVPGPAGWWRPDADAQERARVIAALEAAGGNQGKAAELLGISRRTLLTRLDALGLPRPRKGR